MGNEPIAEPNGLPLLSIVVPVFNEAARLKKSLCTILAYLNEHDRSELIVVDDGSTDATAEVAVDVIRHSGRVSSQVIRNSLNRGKGHAVRAGLLAARAPVAVFTDADLSTPITEVFKLVDPITRGECDFAFGSRAVDRSLIGRRQPWMREMGGRVFNRLVRLTTALPFWDTQCGFKAFRMSVCRPLAAAATIDRFGFDVELLYIAHRAGLRLREIPVRWDHCEGSKVRVWRDALRMMHEIQTVRRLAARGMYDIAISEAYSRSRLEQARRWNVALAG